MKSITLSSLGNNSWYHKETAFVFSEHKIVIGKLYNGLVLPLEDPDVKTCNVYKFKNKPDIYDRMISKFKKSAKERHRPEKKMIEPHQEIRTSYPVRRPVRSMDDSSCCNDLFYYTYGAGFRD